MAYSDAGSAFIFGSLVGRKWTRGLMAQDLSSVSGITGDYLRHCTGEYLYYIGVMGILIASRRYIPESIKYQQVESFVAVTTIFLGQNEIPAIVKPFINFV
ncbi:hypothetical protein ACNKHV_13765 [Shigella flexneri]